MPDGAGLSGHWPMVAPILVTIPPFLSSVALRNKPKSFHQGSSPDHGCNLDQVFA
jgi:hypothetical protein